MAKPKGKSPKSKKPAVYETRIRLNPKLAEAVKQAAAWHGGRSFNAEVEVALEVFVTETMVVGLHEPDFVSDLIRADPEFDVEAYKLETEQSLQALKKGAYSRRPKEALDGVMARMAK